MKLEIDVHVYLHDADDHSRSILHSLLEKVTQMSVDMTNLTAAVAAEKTVLDSAIAFINGVPALVSAAVKQALLDAGTADAAAQAAADQTASDVAAETQAVQAALTANTSAAPPAAPATP
jgi:hypothetical protein